MIRPSICVVVFDDTEHCSGLPEGAKIESVYFYDENTHHHLCSFEPNYWLEYVDTVVTGVEDESGELAELYRPEDYGMYSGTNIKPHVRDDFKDSDHEAEYMNGEVTYEEFLESVREYYQGNAPY